MLEYIVLYLGIVVVGNSNDLKLIVVLLFGIKWLEFYCYKVFDVFYIRFWIK